MFPLHLFLLVARRLAKSFSPISPSFGDRVTKSKFFVRIPSPSLPPEGRKEGRNELAKGDGAFLASSFPPTAFQNLFHPSKKGKLSEGLAFFYLPPALLSCELVAGLGATAPRKGCPSLKAKPFHFWSNCSTQ